jgi:hypothetical protein
MLSSRLVCLLALSACGGHMDPPTSTCSGPLVTRFAGSEGAAMPPMFLCSIDKVCGETLYYVECTKQCTCFSTSDAGVVSGPVLPNDGERCFYPADLLRACGY